MEENSNNNQQPKMQEQKKKEPSIKTKKRKAKAAVITLSTIGVLFLGLQVYASTNGYGNVFFMIKNLITTGNPAGEQEIFSDKDITLSYKSIEVAEGLKIQANRLEIKDGKTKIFLSVKSQDEKQLPLKYEVSTLNTDGTETAKKEIEGNKPENTAYFDYEDILTLDYEVEENAIITLRISDSSNKELRTLEINLQTREITVKGEKDFEKISQIELKKYLSAFSLLNDKSNYTVSDNLIEIATKIQAIDNSKILLKRETINEMAKQIYGENAKFETKKDSQGKDVEVLKDMRVGTYETLDDTYDLMEHDREGKCLKIEDIEFENDIYTVKYIYILATPEDINADKLEDLPQYETTIKLKRNENNTYSKYEIVSLESGIEVKNKVSTDVNENAIKDTLDTSFYKINIYENGEVKISYKYDYNFWGRVAIDENKTYPVTGLLGKVKKMYQANNGTSVDPMTFFLIEDGRIQYFLPTRDIETTQPDAIKINGTIENVNNAVDIKTNGNDVVIAVLKNGQEVKIWNQFMENWENDETTEQTNNTTSSNATVDNYVHYFNWVKYTAPGLKFEYPTELKLENTGMQNKGELSTTITGTLVGRDVDTNQPIYSNIKIKVFNPMIVDEKIMNNLKYNPENGLERTNMTTNKGLKWYESKGQSDEAGYSEAETYSNFNQTSNGVWEMRQIEFVTDNRNNFKITNLINYIIGSTELANW